MVLELFTVLGIGFALASTLDVDGNRVGARQRQRAGVAGLGNGGV